MSNLIIKLGLHWQRFASPEAGLTLLGTVQQDAAIGALACGADGTYWQVNGHHRRKLNASRVMARLRPAKLRLPPHSARTSFAATQTGQPPAPTIVIKRKRILVMP